MAACQAVLSTTELLEPIILNLEWRQIVAIQRVCQQWRVLAQSSSLIREALFLKSNTTARMTWKITSDFGEKAYVAYGTAPDKIISLASADALLNPVAAHFFNLQPGKRFNASQTEFFYRIIKYRVGAQQSAMHTPEASWRAMQLTSPPSLQVSLVCVKHQMAEFVPKRRRQEGSEG